MTYLEAQALIDGDPRRRRSTPRPTPSTPTSWSRRSRDMDTLARLIHARRHKAGMIHLDLPEVELIFDERGKVVGAPKEDDSFTHTIVEMFMVEANEALAHTFEQLRVPVLRRTHPEPTPGDVEDLKKTAMVAGYKIPTNPTREELQTLLDTTAGSTSARAVHTAVLRTFTKAVYSPALIGHFALASHAYAHFTSPIRRYPDLTLHRAVAAYLKRTDNGQDRRAAFRRREDQPGQGAQGGRAVPRRADAQGDRVALLEHGGQRRRGRARAAPVPRAPAHGRAHRGGVRGFRHRRHAQGRVCPDREVPRRRDGPQAGPPRGHDTLGPPAQLEDR